MVNYDVQALVHLMLLVLGLGLGGNYDVQALAHLMLLVLGLGLGGQL